MHPYEKGDYVQLHTQKRRAKLVFCDDELDSYVVEHADGSLQEIDPSDILVPEKPLFPQAAETAMPWENVDRLIWLSMLTAPVPYVLAYLLWMWI